MKTNKNGKIRTVTADQFRDLRYGPPYRNVVWDGIQVSEEHTNVLMYHEFMARLRVRVDEEERLITVLPTEYQIHCIEKFGLRRKFANDEGIDSLILVPERFRVATLSRFAPTHFPRF